MPARILVVDDNEMNLKMVSAILSKEGYEIVTALDAAKALQALESGVPDLAILDVMMPDMDGFELCRRLRHRPDTAAIPIIILTALSELDERLKAFEAGADDFMAKPFQPQELVARVKVLLRRAAPQAAVRAEAQGEVTAVFSLRGGVGVSTLATNLSIGLAQIWAQPVALVDLSLVNGVSALMLDLPLRNSWADLVNIKTEEIDQDVVNRVLLKHDSGVQVLAAPRRPQEAELLNGEQVGRVLGLLRRQVHYLILDLAHDFSEVTLAALDEADRILLLLAPELAAVRCASIALDAFQQLGYAKDKIHLVLNWTFRGKGLPRAEIEKTLNQKIDVVFPHADETMVAALTLGKPPTFAEPTAPVGALFEDLAYYWSKEEHKKNPPKPLPDGYVRVRERARAKQKQGGN
ncbi:MAG: AAA family ATPase [Chloroflexota bacterium]